MELAFSEKDKELGFLVLVMKNASLSNDLAAVLIVLMWESQGPYGLPDQLYGY